MADPISAPNGVAAGVTGADLAYAIGVPPAQAIDHLQAKGLRVSAGWQTVDAATHARAFTVANVARLDVLEAVLQELGRAQREGLSNAQFADQLIPRLERKGWFAGRGQPARVPDGSPPDPATGELPTKKRLTEGRLKTIFETNMQSSMMAARYREFVANTDRRPWWQWVARQGGNRRPAHQAMNGKVFRHDDGLWAGAWPPCGFGCKCRMRARTDADLQAEGLTPDATTGAPTVDRITLADGSTRERLIFKFKGGGGFSPDAGFGGNPALRQAADRLAIAQAPLVLGEVRSQQALRTIFTARQRLEDLQAFVQTAREARAPIGAQRGIGALDDAAVMRLADAGRVFDGAAPVQLADTLVAAAGDRLAVEDWAALPQAIAYGELRWSEDQAALAYAVPALVPQGDRQWLRVLVGASDDGNQVIEAGLATRAEVDADSLVRRAVPR